LAGRIADICHRRSLTLAIAADVGLARTLGADLAHNPTDRPHGLPFSRSVHSLEEAEAAKNDGAALVFVSPVYPTRSHPGGRALGPLKAAEIGRGLGLKLIALGGMDSTRFARVRGLGFHGWAAIDAWLPHQAGEDQKRKAVPT